MKSLPFTDDIIEVLKDNLSNFSIVFGSHVVRKSLPNFVRVSFQPILAVHFGLPCMDMNWFIPLVSVKEKTPAG
jgi:hypothetical protein